ncbi:prolyl 3-hydroxylase OGFOD1 isoform X2 [Cryptotermes secundus]|uniref:prolyl 3-hydroxylase OGFOD1 isoform X2 n=1 Tax=Cryptotermes secundus TaxID=105785 RepID=UPI000CD7BFDE|nr:prolyl 3-hydroxylase OGFOD1 isoform X2 [Cryptotermes secundus]
MQMNMEMKRKVEDITTHSGKLRCERKASFRNHLKENVNAINNCWTSDRSLHSDFDVHMDISPFKHCIVENFMRDTEYLKELKEELLDLKFSLKRNDLYQFHQSCDLSEVNRPSINSLKQFLVEECCTWLEMATGIKLNNKVSVTCSSYNYSDHLLCHDDRCEDRRIAFILYLSEHWQPDYGGSLELFDTDDSGQPKEVVKTILPMFNTFVFFEVMGKSFHQVAEVGTVDRTRLSVNGWFHGPLSECKDVIPNVRIDIHLFSPIQDDCSLLAHVNPMYLDPEIQEQISSSFEQDSEILLPDFFNKDFYKEICNCLCSGEFSWELQGPPNRRYETPREKTLPLSLNKLVQLMKSKEFFKLLGDLTKLELTPFQNNDTAVLQPRCSYEIQRWQKRFYTLLHDDHMSNEYALDAIIHFNVHNVKQLQGGFISYVARDADEELLTLLPSPNALALTFRDKDTLHFVKYINSVFHGCFHMMQFTYYETSSSSSEEMAENVT